MPCTKNCLHITFCIFAFYFFTGTTSSQHCQANWAQDIYCLPGLNGEVYASAVWNDGTGDALYVGGDFTIAGCNTDAVNIARWRGDKWESISTPEHSVVSGPIHAMEVFDGGDGPLLFVGGEFEFAGNVPVYNVAMWDGDQWSPLEDLNGIGIPNCGFSGCIVPIHAMKVFDDGSGPSLYIAGEFSFAGGQQITNIARWNGAEWSYLTNQSMNGMIYDLEVYDDGAGSALYIAGRFSSIGGSPFDNVAKWDGSDWSPLAGLMGEGVDGLAAYAIETFDDGSGEALYVGGHFVSAGGYPVDRIAKWDGLDWSVLPDPDGGTFGGNQAGASIRSLAAFDSGHDSMLVAGGYFTSINGGTVNRVASWDGVEWSPLQHSDSNIGLSSGALPYVHHLNPFMLDGQRNLFIGGRFETAGGYHATNAALWDGSELSAISTPASAGADSRIQGLTTFDDGFSTALIAGGNFKSIGDTQSKYIAAWNGAEWRPLDGPNGYGLSSEVFAVVTHDDGSGPALYAGGRFTFADGINVNRVAKWDGSQWSPLISSNGSAGIGNSYVQTMASYDDGNGAALYVGGFFTQAGGSSARYIAKWNGIDWESLLSGTNDPVYAMTVFDDGTGSALYVGGSFTHANGVWTGSVARWDGSEWTNLFGSSGFATNGRVYALEVYDDGLGRHCLPRVSTQLLMEKLLIRLQSGMVRIGIPFKARPELG